MASLGRHHGRQGIHVGVWMSPWASWIVGVGWYDHLLTPPHHGTSAGPSGCRQGRRDVGRDVGTSAGPSGLRQGRRDVDTAVGTSAGPSGRRQGRRDVGRAVGTSAGTSGRRQGRRDVDRAARCHQDWTNKVRYRNVYRRVL